jgi:hypothetical protein
VNFGRFSPSSQLARKSDDHDVQRKENQKEHGKGKKFVAQNKIKIQDKV